MLLIEKLVLLNDFSTKLSINQHILNKYIDKNDLIYLSQILNLFFKEMDDESSP